MRKRILFIAIVIIFLTRILVLNYTQQAKIVGSMTQPVLSYNYDNSTLKPTNCEIKVRIIPQRNKNNFVSNDYSDSDLQAKTYFGNCLILLQYMLHKKLLEASPGFFEQNSFLMETKIQDLGGQYQSLPIFITLLTAMFKLKPLDVAWIGEIDLSGRVMTYDLGFLDLIKDGLRQKKFVVVGKNIEAIIPDDIDKTRVVAIEYLSDLPHEILDKLPFKHQNLKLNATDVQAVSFGTLYFERGNIHLEQIISVPGNGEIELFGNYHYKTIYDSTPEIRNSLEFMLSPEEIDKLRKLKVIISCQDPGYGNSAGMMIVLGIIAHLRGKSVRYIPCTGTAPAKGGSFMVGGVQSKSKTIKDFGFDSMIVPYGNKDEMIDGVKPFFFLRDVYLKDPDSLMTVDEIKEDLFGQKFLDNLPNSEITTIKAGEYFKKFIDYMVVDELDDQEKSKFIQNHAKHDPMSLQKHIWSNKDVKVAYKLCQWTVRWPIQVVNLFLQTIFNDKSINLEPYLVVTLAQFCLSIADILFFTLTVAVELAQYMLFWVGRYLLWNITGLIEWCYNWFGTKPLGLTDKLWDGCSSMQNKAQNICKHIYKIIDKIRSISFGIELLKVCKIKFFVV